MRAWCNKFFYSIIRLCRRDISNISKCQQRGVKGCRQTAERDHPCRNEYNVRKTAKRRSIAKESQKEQDGHQRCPSNHTRYCNVISVLEVIKLSGKEPEWFSQCPGITASHHWGWEFDRGAKCEQVIGVENLITHGKSLSTLCWKSWVFSGFLQQKKLTGQVRLFITGVSYISHSWEELGNHFPHNWH